MTIISNNYFLPILQLGVMVILCFAVYKDFSNRQSGVIAIVTRGEKSTKLLEKWAGLVITGLVLIVNKSIFDSGSKWNEYSGFINTVNIIAILYVCYFSSWGRNKLIGLAGRASKERH